VRIRQFPTAESLKLNRYFLADLPASIDSLRSQGGIVDPQEPERLKLVRERLGRRSQVGGGIVACIGVFLLLLTPNLHEVAMIFVGIGALLILVGTFARRYFLR
jgi:hypothetical protein